MNETKLLNDGIAALENKIVTVRELCEKQVLVFQKLVCRDEADRPIKENGSLKTKICAFENIETYVDFIVNGKTPQRKPLAFYNGMTMEEYINIQTSTNIYGSRSY